MELLRTAGYTFSRIDTFWCRRRRAVVEKQKIISVGSDKNNVIVPAGYDWWAVCGDFDTPLPPLESSLSPNVISEDQLESILLLSSKVILDCLSQIDVNVEGRESLSAAFLLHCGLLCSVSVPVWVVRGDGAVAVSGLEYIPTVDEGLLIFHLLIL